MKSDYISIDQLDPFGSNPPITPVHSAPEDTIGALSLPLDSALRLRDELLPEIFLDALLVRKDSDVLIVGFHGALNQEKTNLPRFERLSTVLKYPVSSIFFGDPALWKSRDLQLAWYTGWNGLDLQRVIADWALAAAKLVGAKKLVFTGSSGGGFAALQISALIPNSYALVFNAQTDIANYRINGTGFGAQRTFVNVVWPEIAADFKHHSDIESPAWADILGSRSSAVERYAQPTANHVFIVQNVEEFHFEDHFLPFLDAAKRAAIYPASK